MQPYEFDYSVEDEGLSSRTSERAVFIRRTYAHVAGALLAFIALEAFLLNVVPQETILAMFSGGRMGWLLVLGLFMGASFLAQMWARSDTSRGLQYAGLGLYIVAEAIIFLPILWIAQHYFDPSVIPTAALLTLAVFAGLTIAVFTTRQDFSFLSPILSIGLLLAFGVIIASLIFGFTLGVLFSFVMVGLLSACILYETSNIMLHYRTDQYVAAALALFSSIATLFWYILQIVMAFSGRD